MKPKYLKHVLGDHGSCWHLWQAGEVLVGLPDHYFPEGYTGPVVAYHPENHGALECRLPDNYWADLFVKQPPSQVIPELCKECGGVKKVLRPLHDVGGSTQCVKVPCPSCFPDKEG